MDLSPGRGPRRSEDAAPGGGNFSVRRPVHSLLLTTRGRAASKDGKVIEANMSGTAALDYMGALVYELLDAHSDTATLAGGLDADPEWAAHLDYLRDLQRVAREGLARLPGCARPQL